MKSYLGNIYRHLAIFIWSHCQGGTILLGRQVAFTVARFMNV